MLVVPVAQQQYPHEHGVSREAAREVRLRRLEGRTLGRAVPALEESTQRRVAGRLLEPTKLRVRGRVRVRVR